MAPDRADRLVADLAAHPDVWDRGVLVAAVGHRLSEADRRQLAGTGEPSRLVEAMSAAGVLAPVGFVMPMSVGALLMSASTVVVALNAQLLRRLDLRPDSTQ